MPNKKYIKGYRNEKKTREILEKEYSCGLIVESRGSHGPADVYGFAPFRVIIIQVKSSKKYREPTKKEIEYLLSIPDMHYPHKKGIWLFVDYVKKPFKFWY